MTIALTMLLLFCDGSKFQHVCEAKMKACYTQEMDLGIKPDLAFRTCLDDNYRYTAGGDAWDFD